MAVAFDLRFIVPVSPLPPGPDLSALVPFRAEAYAPGDTDGAFTAATYERLRRVERDKFAVLRKLAAGLDAGEVLHFVVGFTPDDLERAAGGAEQRRLVVLAVVGRMLRSLEAECGAAKLSWVASLKLDATIPHAHVAVSRKAGAGALPQRIHKLPAALFPCN